MSAFRRVDALVAAAGWTASASDGTTARLSVRGVDDEAPTVLSIHDGVYELVATTEVFEVARPERSLLTYLNTLNLSLPPGIAVGYRTDKVILRGTLPLAEGHTPHRDVFRALISMIHALRRIVASGRDGRRRWTSARTTRRSRARSRSRTSRTPSRDVPVRKSPRLTERARRVRLPGRQLCRAPGVVAARRLHLRRARTRHDETLLRIARLNGQLQVGVFTLWGDADRHALIYRRALPLIWLALAEEVGRSLVTEDFVSSTMDNASGAWEDVQRVWMSGPLHRPRSDAE